MRDWVMFYIGMFTMAASLLVSGGFFVSFLIGVIGAFGVILAQRMFDEE